jgi:hypothetical protein
MTNATLDVYSTTHSDAVGGKESPGPTSAVDKDAGDVSGDVSGVVSGDVSGDISDDTSGDVWTSTSASDSSSSTSSDARGPCLATA